jgi:phosphatidylglycerol:prolipoprotein diacylglycerol transferase
MIFGWYGLGRMWIEGLRTDSLYLFGSSIRVSQALAAVLFVICTSLLVYFCIKKPNRPFYRMEPAKATPDKSECTNEENENKFNSLEVNIGNKV